MAFRHGPAIPFLVVALFELGTRALPWKDRPSYLSTTVQAIGAIGSVRPRHLYAEPTESVTHGLRKDGYGGAPACIVNLC